MNAIKRQEIAIIELINSGEKAAVTAFSKLTERFSDDDRMNSTNHSEIIRIIYVVCDNTFVKQIAKNLNLSESTFHRLRRLYVKWFHYYRNKILQEMNPAA